MSEPKDDGWGATAVWWMVCFFSSAALVLILDVDLIAVILFGPVVALFGSFPFAAIDAYNEEMSKKKRR